MKTIIEHNNKTYHIDLSKPLDISTPLKNTIKNITAWFVNPPQFTPVMENGFVGDVNKGGSVNFNNIFFNPHGHGTHTECVGHISQENYTINQCLKQFFFLAKLITITPQAINKDYIITEQQIKQQWKCSGEEAIIIRTLPNNKEKLTKQYTNTNPAFIDKNAVKYLTKNGIAHLLIDTPSIDKEKDGGKLAAHHVFWQYPKNTQNQRTITEMIYVANKIKDGMYFLNIQIASFENDASPSKPILYKITSF